jgi:hypothetical protein
MDWKAVKKEREERMDKSKLNDEAWSIVDHGNSKRRPSRKRKLTPRQREFEAFKRREESMRRKRLDGSQGAAGPCKRIDPVTGEIIGIVTKPRRASPLSITPGERF